MKNTNKILNEFAVMACIMLLLSGAVAAAGQQQQTATTGTNDETTSPTSLIVDYNMTHVDKKLKPGDLGTITIVLKNTGDLYAKEVEASLPSTGNIHAGSYQELGTINHDQTTIITTTIRIEKNAYIGTHILSLRLKYKMYYYANNDLESRTEETNWEIPIQVYGDVNFAVQNISDDIVAGRTQEYAMTLKNSGESSVNDVSATLISRNEDIIVIENNFDAGSVKADEAKTLEFKIYVGDKLPGGTYPAVVKLSFDDGTGTRYEEIDTGIVVASGSRKPQIAISDMSITPEKIEPGNEVNIKITIKNVGDSNAQRIDLKLDPSQLPFTSSGSGTSTYVDELNNSKVYAHEFTLISDKTAEVKSYSVPLTVTYSNDKGIEQTPFKDVVGVTLKGKAQLNIANIKVEQLSSNSKNSKTLQIRVENTGTGDAEAVRVLVESPAFGKKEAPLGKIGVDEDTTAIFDVNFKEVNGSGDGKASGFITVKYEDDFGKSNITDNFEFMVSSSGDGGSPVLIILAIIIIAAAVAVYRKYLKN
ncbi:MAG: hypothetical protein BWK75_03445 [Candidatus Altiarchaeales archaeon A3]|nr:MAG: hypothetical protein BWK75_03445 [Candidatus Altiarchaeales archaeon A3]